MFLLIDNYDSFTYNLVQAFYALGHQPVVRKNDDPAILEMAQSPDLDMVVISPGPGRPEQAGLCPRFLELIDPQVPILGVCLGHQLLGLHAGASIEISPAIMHGKQSHVRHNGQGLFKNLPQPMLVGRYHSLIVKSTPESDALIEVTASGPQGEIMGLRYKDRPWAGVQFHPESILTPDGLRLLDNFPKGVIEESKRADNIANILETLAQGRDLTPAMALSGFSALMDGELTPVQAGAFLMGLRAKGESAVELGHAARAALARAKRVEGLSGATIDIVGTGGDGTHSFNCSTATSLYMAALGYRVVKHGNRAVSSTCGAADALEGLGFPLPDSPEEALAELDRRNFCFLFAPHFHPSFRNIGPARRELGVRTLFNILGPLINPARPSHLLMGVARPELVELIANVLAQSPLYRGAVVCGAGGYDEMTPIGPAKIALIQEGRISWLDFDPARFAIPPCQPFELAVHSREEAIEVLRQILAGRGPAPMRNMVALNLALAIFLMEENWTLDEAMEKAREAVAAGAGQKAVAHA